MVREMVTQHPVRCILILVAVMNMLLFTGWRMCVDKSLQCVQYRAAKDLGHPINYLIAGNVAQPEQGFAFLLDELEGEIVFCNYQQCGWSPEQSAEEICADIQQRLDGLSGETLVRIYAVSCGDIVARYLESMSALIPYADIEIIAINPASSPQLLKPPIKWGLKIVAPLLKGVCHLAGFASCIPFIPGTDSWHSPILLADQWMELAWSNAPHETSSTVSAIISTNDEFLVNEEIVKYFEGVRIIEVVSKHADAKGHGREYARACQLAIEASG